MLYEHLLTIYVAEFELSRWHAQDIEKAPVLNERIQKWNQYLMWSSSRVSLRTAEAVMIKQKVQWEQAGMHCEMKMTEIGLYPINSSTSSYLDTRVGESDHFQRVIIILYWKKEEKYKWTLKDNDWNIEINTQSGIYSSLDSKPKTGKISIDQIQIKTIETWTFWN